MMRLVVLVCLLATALPAAAAAPDGGALTRARRAYNEGRYDAAAGAARTAVANGADRDVSQLLLSRALLERYGQHHDPRDLSEARQALQSITPSNLPFTDRAEWLVGYGQWLYLTERYGAAAELFDDAAGRALAGGPAAHDRVLDWWASALERHAQANPPERDRIYTRIFSRMDSELERDPGSVAANYWIVASARALGELDRAWTASMAGWVRAALAGSRAGALRTDLDRLVLTGIIPDRARATAAAEGLDKRQAADTMVTEWERFKQEWDEGRQTSNSR
jgi:hypothetical protein